MAERDKHINQGDRSLLPILKESFSAFEGKKAFGRFFLIAAPRVDACRGGEGEQGGEEVPTTSYLMGGEECLSSVF